MKNIFRFGIVALVVGVFTVAQASAELVFNQDFDSGTWSFVETPATYNGASGSDQWEATTNVGGGSGSAITSGSSGATFWGMRDLNNPNGGGNFDHVLTFSNLDSSSFTSRVLTFDYNYVLYENADYLRYEVVLDGTGQGEVDIIGTSTSGSSAGWETVTFNIDDAVGTVGLRLVARQDGGSDWAGWDNVQLNGTAVPEPTTLAMFAIAMAGLGYRRRR